jgi:CheY-like chemotaxis protein
MARVRIVHWKMLEAAPLIEACRACGFEVEYDDVAYPALAKLIREKPPDALLIDLTVLPSHGRDIALHLRRTKYTRHIPLVFVDGAPEKVEAIRLQLPDAVFTTSAARKQLCSRIRSACANRIAEPVIPPSPMERYGSRTAAQKLGIKENATVALIDPPRDYAAALGELPAGAELLEDPDPVQTVTLWFVRDPRVYQAEVHRMREIANRTKLWVVWRKGSAGKDKGSGLTDKLIRQAANEAGLVDYKICAVNEQWSAMAFARRKA